MPELHLSLELLELFGTGTLHCKEVARVARAARRDGWGEGDFLAERLAAAQRPRDLYRAARQRRLMEALPGRYFFEVPGRGGPRETSCFLPHETLQGLAETEGLQPFTLSAAELAAESGVGRTLTQWSAHPDVAPNLAREITEVVAIGMHADGVRYSADIRAGSARNLYVMSWNFLAGSPEQRARRFLFCVLAKHFLCDCGCEGFHTFQAVFAVFAWSMSLLLGKASPTRRHDNSWFTAWDRKHRLRGIARLPAAALVQIRGDWEWLCQCFRFRSYGADVFCYLCEACRSAESNMCYRRFTPEADHRSTLLTHVAYFAALALEREEPSSIFLVPGVTLMTCAIDSMHTLDLGPGLDALGSLFWCEITNKAWHRTNEAGLEWLNEQLSCFAAANEGVGPLVLTMSMLKGKEKYPSLKCKAALSRHYTSFGLMLAQMHAHGVVERAPFAFHARSRLSGQEAAYRRLVVDTFSGLCSYHEACKLQPFGAEAKLQCKRGMYEFLQSLESLSSMWRVGLDEEQQKVQPWHMRQKAHMLQHLVEDQLDRWGSPILSWCYRDEDYIGDSKKVAERSKHKTLEANVMDKTSLSSGVGLHRAREAERLRAQAHAPHAE